VFFWWLFVDISLNLLRKFIMLVFLLCSCSVSRVLPYIGPGKEYRERQRCKLFVYLDSHSPLHVQQLHYTGTRKTMLWSLSEWMFIRISIGFSYYFSWFQKQLALTLMKFFPHLKSQVYSHIWWFSWSSCVSNHEDAHPPPPSSLGDSAWYRHKIIRMHMWYLKEYNFGPKREKYWGVLLLET
jgi:hypothetical protein